MRSLAWRTCMTRGFIIQVGCIPFDCCIKSRPLISLADIKPANITVNLFENSDGAFEFRNVQITDLEDAVVLPPNARGLDKRLSGNMFWRSPEAWARAVQNTPADIFSFGIVVCSLPTLNTRRDTDKTFVCPPRLYTSGSIGWYSSRTRQIKLRTRRI